MVTWKQLVGVALFVFVQEKHAGHVKDVSVETVKTGLQGATGNKGGVGIRMVVRNTSMAFVCSHFAAGQKEVNERNSDYDSIARKLIFNYGVPLWAHDYVFWCGDFNYRISMSREEVADLIHRQEWGLLLEHDQLRISQKEGKCFKGFLEGDINFAPTYKYDLFSDDYDTSEKCRIPAWTDRVLFWARQYPKDKNNPKWVPGKIVHYGRAELKQSDHRPVLCIIDVEGRTVNDKKRADVYNYVVETLGPTDCSVVIKLKNNNREENMKSLLTEELLDELNSQLEEFGTVVMARFLEDAIVVAFKDAQVALNISSSSSHIKVGNYDLVINLKTENWREQLQEELALCGDTTIPLLEGHFEDIEEPDMDISLDNVEGVMEQLYLDDQYADGLDQEPVTPTPITPTTIEPPPLKPARPAPPRPAPSRPPPPRPTPPSSGPASPALSRSDKHFEPIEKPERPAQLFSPRDIPIAYPNGMSYDDFPDPPSTLSTPTPPPVQPPSVPSRTPSFDSPFSNCISRSPPPPLQSSQSFPSPPSDPPPSLPPPPGPPPKLPPPPPSVPPPTYPYSDLSLGPSFAPLPAQPFGAPSAHLPPSAPPTLPPPGPPPTLPPRSPSHAIKSKDNTPPHPSRSLPPVPARTLPPVPPRK